MLWDRLEPAGYVRAVSVAPLPNTPAHRVVFQYGLGDAQVSWLGTEILARSTRAVMFESNVRCGARTNKKSQMHFLGHTRIRAALLLHACHCDLLALILPT